MTRSKFYFRVSLFLATLFVISCDDDGTPTAEPRYYLRGEIGGERVNLSLTSGNIAPGFGASALSFQGPTSANSFGSQFNTDRNGPFFLLDFVFQFDTSKTSRDKLVINDNDVLGDLIASVDWTFDPEQDTSVNLLYEEDASLNSGVYWISSFADPELNRSNRLIVDSVNFVLDESLGAGLIVSGSFDVVLGSSHFQNSNTLSLRDFTFRGFWRIPDPDPGKW